MKVLITLTVRNRTSSKDTRRFPLYTTQHNPLGIYSERQHVIHPWHLFHQCSLLSSVAGFVGIQKETTYFACSYVGWHSKNFASWWQSYMCPVDDNYLLKNRFVNYILYYPHPLCSNKFVNKSLGLSVWHLFPAFINPKF